MHKKNIQKKRKNYMQRVSLHFKNKSISKCSSVRPLLLGFKTSLPIEKTLSTAGLEGIAVIYLITISSKDLLVKALFIGCFRRGSSKKSFTNVEADKFSARASPPYLHDVESKIDFKCSAHLSRHSDNYTYT